MNKLTEPQAAALLRYLADKELTTDTPLPIAMEIWGLIDGMKGESLYIRREERGTPHLRRYIEGYLAGVEHQSEIRDDDD